MRSAWNLTRSRVNLVDRIPSRPHPRRFSTIRSPVASSGAPQRPGFFPDFDKVKNEEVRSSSHMNRTLALNSHLSVSVDSQAMGPHTIQNKKNTQGKSIVKQPHNSIQISTLDPE